MGRRAMERESPIPGHAGVLSGGNHSLLHRGQAAGQWRE